MLSSPGTYSPSRDQGKGSGQVNTARLTGWKIDIKPASAPLEPIEEMQQEELEDDALVAEEPVESVEE